MQIPRRLDGDGLSRKIGFKPEISINCNNANIDNKLYK